MVQIEHSVDCVIFGFEDNSLKVLLIKRKQEPSQGLMALPGDFISAQTGLKESAENTLLAITGLNNIFLEQIGTFGETDRYPKKRVITTGYYALINVKKYNTTAGHTAEALAWCSINDLPPLAFDHKQIILAALEILKRNIRHQPIGFNLLPEKFSLTELQQLYESILGTPLNKRNFRAKIEQMKLLVDTGHKQTNVAHKPAKLYHFDATVYSKLADEGFYFKL